MSVAGAGALAGALHLAIVGDVSRKGRRVALSSLGASACLIIFAFSNNLWLSIPALLIIGFCLVSGIASTNIILQSSAPDELRGRVMSVFTLMFIGIAPIGNLIIGALAQAWGIRVAVGIGGAICAMVSVCYIIVI